MPQVEVDLTELPNLTNDEFYPFYFNQSRYLVLKGGGGSGKSVFTAQKLIVRALSETPHRFLICRKVAKTLRESVFKELKNVIERWGLGSLFKIPKGHSSELYIKCYNGNEFIFSGLDDVEKLKSIVGVTSVWVEEASELDPGDFRQLNIRMRGRTVNYKQMILSFNPIDINHWLKKEFFDKPKENALTHHSTYHNNKFLPEEDRQVLEEFADSDPYYYSVYCLGEWGVTGKTIFSAQKVNDRIAVLRDQEPLRRGFFAFEYDEEKDKIVEDTIQWVDDDDGYITIYEEPQPRVPFVLGGDTAGDGSDSFAGQVLNNMTGSQAAVLHHQFDEDVYTRQMFCLGRHYNTALIGIETNFSTYPVKELSRLGYGKQYVREIPDTFTGKLAKKFGFVTTKLTRPLIIGNLVKLVREHPELMMDIETLLEMLTFVRNERGKAEAKEGAHDDRILALAIAHHIRDQQTRELLPIELKPRKMPLPFMTQSQQEEGYAQW